MVAAVAYRTGLRPATLTGTLTDSLTLISSDVAFETVSRMCVFSQKISDSTSVVDSIDLLLYNKVIKSMVDRRRRRRVGDDDGERRLEQRPAEELFVRRRSDSAFKSRRFKGRPTDLQRGNRPFI